MIFRDQMRMKASTQKVFIYISRQINVFQFVCHWWPAKIALPQDDTPNPQTLAAWKREITRPRAVQVHPDGKHAHPLLPW